MISEGRPNLDPVYSLREGVLRLELPKELYERAGLVGTAIRDGGRKHIKARYAIEFNLRLPSMLHGKKGFERLVWAAKNVLNERVSWLFFDFQASKGVSPLAEHHPIHRAAKPDVQKLKAVKIPPMTLPTSDDSDVFQEDCMDILEWFDLGGLGSPRIDVTDSLDPYLSSYTIPSADMATEGNLVCITWHGFIPGIWVRNLFMLCL